MQNSQELSHYLEVPLIADSVDSPIVQYGREMTAIHFSTNEGQWGRVTFEKLDSLKISRGEYEPFSSAPDDPDDYHWVSTVSNSVWLRERYEYEKKYYGDSYNFNGNVDEMLDEFSHYIFSFHDQFVEVIAAGVWFECDDKMLEKLDWFQDHPLKGLAHIKESERFEYSGISCLVRRNPLSNDELKENAKMCSQTILEIAAELDGNASSFWSLTHRIQNGVGRSYLRCSFGNAVETYEGLATLSTIQPRIDKWLLEVSKRRLKMGKSNH